MKTALNLTRFWLILIRAAWLSAGAIGFFVLHLWMGDLSFALQQATDTLTPTASLTNGATPTASVQPSATLTATRTLSPTLTATLAVTTSPTQTALPSFTSAPGFTASPQPLPSEETPLLTPEEAPATPTATATYAPLPVVTYQFPQRTTTLSILEREQPSISEKTPKSFGFRFLWQRFTRRIGPYAPLFFLGAIWAGLALWFFFAYVFIERK